LKTGAPALRSHSPSPPTFDAYSGRLASIAITAANMEIDVSNDENSDGSDQGQDGDTAVRHQPFRLISLSITPR
jgi:hypothetical protein